MKGKWIGIWLRSGCNGIFMGYPKCFFSVHMAMENEWSHGPLMIYIDLPVLPMGWPLKEGEFWTTTAKELSGERKKTDSDMIWWILMNIFIDLDGCTLAVPQRWTSSQLNIRISAAAHIAGSGLHAPCLTVVVNRACQTITSPRYNALLSILYIYKYVYIYIYTGIYICIYIYIYCIDRWIDRWIDR